jgi:hypothetical protein
MEAVEFKRSIKQLSDSPHFIDHTKEIPSVVKTDLDTSWISSMFIKPEKVVITRLDLEDPKEVKVLKVQLDIVLTYIEVIKFIRFVSTETVSTSTRECHYY